MLPAVSGVPIVNQNLLSLVATPILQTNALRVPHDNVAPSVSNAAINNNLKNASQTLSAQTAPIPAAVTTSFPSLINNLSAGLGAGAGTTFLAQMIGQDGSFASSGILMEYEKLVALANVKYKPSMAGKPQAEPANMFGKLLQQEKVQQVVVNNPPPATVETAAAHTLMANPVRQAAPATTRSNKPADAATENTRVVAKRSDTTQAIHAYTAAAGRVADDVEDKPLEAVQKL